jgi:hypothetical protein
VGSGTGCFVAIFHQYLSLSEWSSEVDPLAFISKLLGITWKVGAAIAAVAAVIYYGRQQGISIFFNLNDKLFKTIIVAGLIGAVIVSIDLLVAFARLVLLLVSRILQHKANKTALKNMQSLTREFAEVLRFLKSNNAKRFIAPNDNALLSEMQMAGLLIQDDPDWTVYARTTYYLVPEYVWNEIDNVLKDFPLPPSQPWLRHH